MLHYIDLTRKPRPASSECPASAVCVYRRSFACCFQALAISGACFLYQKNDQAHESVFFWQDQTSYIRKGEKNVSVELQITEHSCDTDKYEIYTLDGAQEHKDAAPLVQNRLPGQPCQTTMATCCELAI
jgi:hypothetical protein